MKSIVDQALGNIVNGDTGVILELAGVENTLVRDEAIATCVENRIGVCQPLGNIVRIENRHLRRFAQACPTHHADVHPRDRQNQRTTPRRTTDHTLSVAKTSMAR